MVNNTRMFTGRRWHLESRLYQYGHRHARHPRRRETRHIRHTGKDIYGGVAVVDAGPSRVPASIDAQLLPCAELFNAAVTRAELVAFTTGIHLPTTFAKQRADVELVEL